MESIFPKTKLICGDTLVVVWIQDQDWVKILALAFRGELSEMGDLRRDFCRNRPTGGPLAFQILGI